MTLKTLTKIANPCDISARCAAPVVSGLAAGKEVRQCPGLTLSFSPAITRNSSRFSASIATL
jgi:hypothetical protein